MLKGADSSDMDEELIEKLIPVLDEYSKYRIFELILDGEMDWHMITVLMPYMDYITSQIEAAVVYGFLLWEVLGLMREVREEIYKRRFGEN